MLSVGEFWMLRIVILLFLTADVTSRAETIEVDISQHQQNDAIEDASCPSSAPVAQAGSRGGRALLQSGSEAKVKSTLTHRKPGAAPAPAPQGIGLLAGAPNPHLVKEHIKRFQNSRR